MSLLEITPNGLYCGAGEFYIDPWGPAERAVLTHAHAAHGRAAGSYLVAKPGERLVRALLRPEALIECVDYGGPITIGPVRVSLHPSGHILGSAQVRLERAGEVWVFSGHYKLAHDPTCDPFEPLVCHTFVTEATYGLPIFRWRPDAEVRDTIHSWWRANQQAGRVSLLFAHPIGKAQRLLALLDSSIGPIYCHEAVESVNRLYREHGIELPPASAANAIPYPGSLILAPPSANGSAWAKRFGPASNALASGWMRIRGTRRRRSLDRGFAFSDHADWPALLRAVEATRAEAVCVTGGFRGAMVRWIEEHGGAAFALEGQWEEAEP
ncbi:MAG: ligase-associated DNA damage response exonuclease [Acidobacteriia bacterium]|nr:ligase-associated DNA damage response exonuclease [Terriglobia bacterium]